MKATSLPKEPKEAKKSVDKGKSKVPKKEGLPVEEGTFEKPALRKATTVKREIEEPQLETVTLKSHAFEKDPQDTTEEMSAKVIMGKPLKILTQETEEKQRNAVKKKKKKQKEPTPQDASEITEDAPLEDVSEDLPESQLVPEASATVSKEKDLPKAKRARPQLGKTAKLEEEEVNVEQVERKERDPIAVPGAAVVKKHSDVERVELPAFLNFPTEQGEVVDLAETKEKSPKILPVEPRTIFEEEDIQLNTADKMQEATKVMKKVEKKKTTKKNQEEPGISEPRIIPITVTETDHSSEVSLCALLTLVQSSLAAG